MYHGSNGNIQTINSILISSQSYPITAFLFQPRSDRRRARLHGRGFSSTQLHDIRRRWFWIGKPFVIYNVRVMEKKSKAEISVSKAFLEHLPPCSCKRTSAKCYWATQIGRIRTVRTKADNDPLGTQRSVRQLKNTQTIPVSVVLGRGGWRERG